MFVLINLLWRLCVILLKIKLVSLQRIYRQQMIERIVIIDNADPVSFYGVNQHAPDTQSVP